MRAQNFGRWSGYFLGTAREARKTLGRARPMIFNNVTKPGAVEAQSKAAEDGRTPRRFALS
jgi:hypothetical protein